MILIWLGPPVNALLRYRRRGVFGPRAFQGSPAPESSLARDGFLRRERKSGVGNGNRTRNRRSHSPVLYQLSYSHRHADYTTALRRCQKRT